MSTVSDGALKAAQEDKPGQPISSNGSIKAEPKDSPSVEKSTKSPKSHGHGVSAFTLYQANECGSDASSDTSTLVGDEIMESLSDIKVTGLGHSHRMTPSSAQRPTTKDQINDQKLSQHFEKTKVSEDEPMIVAITNKDKPKEKTETHTALTSTSNLQTQTPKRKKSNSNTSPTHHDNKRLCQNFPSRPTSYAGAIQAGSPKSNTNEPPSYVAYIMPKDHSEVNCEQADHIRDSLINLLYPPNTKHPAPARFIQYGLTQALFKITCADPESVEWIIHSAKHIPPINDTEFIAVRGNELPKYISMSTFYPRKGPTDLPNIRSRLIRSNPHLNIPTWKVYWSAKKEMGLQVCYGISEKEVDKLKADGYTAWFELSYVSFVWSRNPTAPPSAPGSSRNIPLNYTKPPQKNSYDPKAQAAQNPNRQHDSQGIFLKHKDARPKHSRGQNRRPSHTQSVSSQGQSQHTQKGPIDKAKHHTATSSKSQKHSQTSAEFRPPPPVRHSTPICSPKSEPVPLLSLNLQPTPDHLQRRTLLPKPDNSNKRQRHMSQ